MPMHREVFVEGAIIAATGGFAAIGTAIAMSLWRAREDRDVATYGSARWAAVDDIHKAGLLSPDGAVLGRWETTICATTVPST